jgi:hypothetical protein
MFVFILDNQNIILLLVWLKMVKDKAMHGYACFVRGAGATFHWMFFDNSKLI